jgi:hypothetical protein
MNQSGSLSHKYISTGRAPMRRSGHFWSFTMSDPSKVGYGRPPVSSRFKPGSSGNPTGRPKGTASFRVDFAEELAEVIAVPGDSRKVCTKRRAIVKKLVADALSGEAKDAAALVLLCAKLLPEHEEEDPRAADDQAFVDKLAERERQDADQGISIPSPSTKELKDD